MAFHMTRAAVAAHGTFGIVAQEKCLRMIIHGALLPGADHKREKLGLALHHLVDQTQTLWYLMRLQGQ